MLRQSLQRLPEHRSVFYLSVAPQAAGASAGLSAAPQAAGASAGLSAAPQAAGVSAGLSAAPQAAPQAAFFSSAGLSAAPQAEETVPVFQEAMLESAICSSSFLISGHTRDCIICAGFKLHKYALFCNYEFAFSASTDMTCAESPSMPMPRSTNSFGMRASS